MVQQAAAAEEAERQEIGIQAVVQKAGMAWRHGMRKSKNTRTSKTCFPTNRQEEKNQSPFLSLLSCCCQPCASLPFFLPPFFQCRVCTKSTHTKGKGKNNAMLKCLQGKNKMSAWSIMQAKERG